MSEIHLTATVPIELAGRRLDQLLPLLFGSYSRSRFQQWIKNQQIQVNGNCLRAKDKVKAGDCIVIAAQVEANPIWQAQDIPLNIVHEDDALLIINKPSQLVVHPAAGNPDGTLVNALLHHAPQLAELPRAGIVHRLDKDTTGLLVVAKTLAAHAHLVDELQSRRIKRAYQAIVYGEIVSGNTIEAPIGRHPKQRKLMAVVEGGKPARTHFRTAEKYPGITCLDVTLETGRTHQIRVHLAHIKHPIVGDVTYGGRLRIPKGSAPSLIEYLQNFKRQALHAKTLGLLHPLSQDFVEWTAELPEDMLALKQALKENSAA